MRFRIPAVLSPLILAACASTPLPQVLTYNSPESDTTATPVVGYVNPVGDYNPRLPVDPKPWRQQNDSQSPVKGGEG